MNRLWRSCRARVSAIFKDRRYRGERVFLFLGLPLVLAVLAALLAGLLLHGRMSAEVGTVTDEPRPALAPPKRDPAAELGSALDAQDAAGVREALAKLPPDAPTARRGRAKLAMLAEDFPAARREWDGVIAACGRDAPEAEDFFLRGLCLYALDERSAAGADFAEAAARSPSNFLYSNRHDIFLIGAGSRQAVAEKIRIGLALRNESLRTAWIVPHALIALQEGNPLLAELLLERASKHFTPSELACLLDDHSFDSFRSTASLAPYFIKNPARNRPRNEPHN